jgi:N-acetylglutamate synthase
MNSPSPAYALSLFALEDFPAALALWEKCEGIGIAESDTIEAVGRFLERNPGLSWVARVEGQLVGAVLCGHDGRRGFLYHLAVAKEHRRLGIGQAMVAACLAKLNEAGVKKCNIMVYRDNRDGQEFWRRRGWSAREDLLLVQQQIRTTDRSC